MKKLILVFVVLSFLFVSCEKDKEDVEVKIDYSQVVTRLEGQVGALTSYLNTSNFDDASELIRSGYILPHTNVSIKMLDNEGYSSTCRASSGKKTMDSDPSKGRVVIEGDFKFNLLYNGVAKDSYEGKFSATFVAQSDFEKENSWKLSEFKQTFPNN
jgi:hypothetical protein